MIIYFDTETTGLTPGRVVQLSYIIEEDNGDVSGKNFFFAVDCVPLEAQRIHGFSEEKLRILSKGKVFADFIDEIEKDFETADMIIAHNVEFDIAFMNAEFEREGRKFHYNLKFDTVSHFTDVCKIPRTNNKGYKYPKLIEVGIFFELTEESINELASKLFGSDAVNAHDARFDTTMLYKCVYNHMQFHPDFLNI